MLYKHCFTLCFLFWIQAVGLHGQADSIMSYPKELQSEALWNWYSKNQGTDTVILFPKLEEMITIFQKSGAVDLAHDAWVQKVLRSVFVYNPSVIPRIDKAIEETLAKGWKVQEVILINQKGYSLFSEGKYVAGFANMIRSYEMMNDLGYEHFGDIKRILLNIGHTYLGIRDYDRAIRYIKEAISIPFGVPDPLLQVSMMNSLGICYMRKMEYDSAVLCYVEANKAATEVQHEFWMALTNGNLGNAYFKKGLDDKALPLLEKDFITSLKYSQTTSAVNAALSLATIYLKKGNSEKAEYYVRFCEKYVDRNDDNAMAAYYDNQYLLNRIRKDYQQAIANADSAKVHRDRFLAREDKSITEKARLLLEMEKHDGELKLLEATRKRQVVMRNAMLAIVILSGIIASLLINRRYLKRKKELDLAHVELKHYTDTIRKKNELIDSFTDELEKIRISGMHQADERTEQIEQLIHVSLLTERDWQHFRQLFDKVHPGFIVRLKEKIPDLNPAEIRLLALTKLQLAPREMASMLGISYESIKKSRQRLRKKIHLSEEGSLDELVDMI